MTAPVCARPFRGGHREQGPGLFGVPIPIPGGGSYTDFILPGLLALNLTSSAIGTAVALATDLHEGMIDRFRVRLLAVVGYSMRRAHQQEPGVGRLVWAHRTVPARVRVQRDGADPAHTQLAEAVADRNPGQRRSPPALGQSEPVLVAPRPADATPIDASLAWSVLILAVAAPPVSRYFRHRTTE